MAQEVGLRQERDFGPTAPLVSDEKGDYTRPVNFRKRYYRILKAAGIEQKGLHSLSCRGRSLFHRAYKLPLRFGAPQDIYAPGRCRC